MPAFHFRFDKLLDVRRQRRDLCRQALADAVIRENELSQTCRRIEAERAAEIAALARLGVSGPLDVSASRERRAFVDRLAREFDQIEQERQLAALQIEQCRQTLILAEQAVGALEKLAETRHAAWKQSDDRRETHEREDVWQAGRTSQSLP